MGLYDFRPEDVIDQRERFKVPKKLEPAVDEIISKIVGFKIYQCDPRVINLVVKWRKEKLGRTLDSNEPDNFLEKPKFIEELKEVLSKDLC